MRVGDQRYQLIPTLGVGRVKGRPTPKIDTQVLCRALGNKTYCSTSPVIKTQVQHRAFVGRKREKRAFFVTSLTVTLVYRMVLRPLSFFFNNSLIENGYVIKFK